MKKYYINPLIEVMEVEQDDHFLAASDPELTGVFFDGEQSEDITYGQPDDFNMNIWDMGGTIQ